MSLAAFLAFLPALFLALFAFLAILVLMLRAAAHFDGIITGTITDQCRRNGWYGKCRLAYGGIRTRVRMS